MALNKGRIYIYLSEHLYKAYGVKVIVDRVETCLENAKIVFSLEEIPNGSIVIPYGVLEAYQVILAKRFRLSLALLIDAYSLGVKSNFFQFLFKSYVPFTYKIKCLLRYFKYLYLEYRILKDFDRIILVSWGDKEYYENMWLTNKYASKISVIPNGVNILDYNREHNHNNTIKIGCLSHWNIDTIYPFYMFLNEVWKKIPSNKGLELIVAGRGLTKEMRDYISDFKNVTIIGEVEKLDVFYDLIDVSLVTMVKKCGIINRLLDGFSYKTPVICRPENLCAFNNLPDCCYTYTDVNTFLSELDNIKQKPEVMEKKVNMAYEYIVANNWDTNYSNFTLDILD